jgi:endonuclease G
MFSFAGPGLETPYISDSVEYVIHKGFEVEYTQTYKEPIWVAYMLTSQRVSGKIKRNNLFRFDPFVKGGSALPADYAGAKDIDRGHLYSAEDARWDSNAMHDCFYMTNMCPQVSEFNRGIWKNLETQERKWAIQYDTIYSVAGPVLQPGMRMIGHRNQIAVPNYFFKVILRTTNLDTCGIGFIFKNEKSTLDIQSFVVTVDSVEQLTGIIFYPKIPKSDLNNVKISKWFK